MNDNPQPTTTLSSEDIEFFRDNGYLIKRNVLDSDLMARARESLWAAAPPELNRDDPDSWIGPFKERCDDKNSARHGFIWKYRAEGGEPWMIQLLAKDPSVWAMAEQLLGHGNLSEPERVRGIYCIMPEGEAPERPYGCHVDAHPFHLGVVGYIDDVNPYGGGFVVWPGSHQQFYYTFTSEYVHNRNDRFVNVHAKVNKQSYVDCHGKAGDIVFWHHRIGHSAGHNRTHRIRQAVLYDFKRKDLDQSLDNPPHEDMWHHWDGVRS
ncbi:phytanoyl-CoA dioxygenase family protein [Chloroflexi bacterium TSY]|nr:phytanoyl-CoA dioxygenase family protein [Chloroflexi bacterium TSY]